MDETNSANIFFYQENCARHRLIFDSYRHIRVHICAANLHAKFQQPSSYSVRDLSVHPDGQTDGHDQEYIYFIGSKTPPSASYIRRRI